MASVERKVLVVDDDVHIRRLMALYLRDAQWDVTQAASGEEALDFVQRERFDVAIVDLILPHYGGSRLCQRLKAMSPPFRVIITSGDDSQSSRAAAAESGADGFLAKPFTREELLAAV
jgi:two-component system response regulator ResD